MFVANKIIIVWLFVLLFLSGHHGKAEHSYRDPVLDGSRSDSRNWVQLCGRHLVAGNHCNRNGWRQTTICRYSSYEGKDCGLLECIAVWKDFAIIAGWMTQQHTIWLLIWSKWFVFCQFFVVLIKLKTSLWEGESAWEGKLQSSSVKTKLQLPVLGVNKLIFSCIIQSRFFLMQRQIFKA